MFDKIKNAFLLITLLFLLLPVSTLAGTTGKKSAGQSVRVNTGSISQDTAV